MAPVGEQEGAEDPIRLFGDPRAHFIDRGPERRTPDPDVAPLHTPLSAQLHHHRPDASRALRVGRGDPVATALLVLGALSFTATLVAGSLILYNAKTVGAFSNPWDSTRVAIGIAVFAIGTILSALLIGTSRAITYLLAVFRQRAREMERHTTAEAPSGLPADEAATGT